MSGSLQSWAAPRLGALLPLDDESIKEIIAYTTTLSKDASAEHLKNLLGDSPQAFEFISSFNARLPQKAADRPPPSARSEDHSGVPSPMKKAPKRTKAPLHSAGPARVPEGYGDVRGGYSKQYDDDHGAHSPRPGSRDPKDGVTSKAPEAEQDLPSASDPLSGSARTPRHASPAKAAPKLPPSAAGNLISDFGFANVRSKQSKKAARATHSPHLSGASNPSKGAITTSSLADLTAAIAALEVAAKPTLSTRRRTCPCNASVHPLFETAPNCLNCGKIICALEGLQPCSFCDAPILSRDQVESMIKALKEERGVEKMAVHNAAQSLSGRGTPVFGGSTPEGGSGDEASPAAARARAHRDKLLAFQRENAQRTRVHDEAADYDLTLTPGTTQWMSPVQRAAALKKQQKYMREMEEANRPEWERQKTVMSMSIKNGKVVKTYERQKTAAATHAAPDDAVDGDGDGDEVSTDQHRTRAATAPSATIRSWPLAT